MARTENPGRMGAFHDDRTSREINERAVDTARGPMGSSDEADELVSAKEVDEEDYEQERLLNIQRNRELLATLGIDKPLIKQTEVDTKSKASKAKTIVRPKRVRADAFPEPTRRSSRIANRPVTSTSLSDNDSDQASSSRPQAKATIIKQQPRVVVPVYSDDDDEDFDPGYVAPPPTRDQAGTLHFKDMPHFTPNMTPEEIMRAGAFGGSYWRDRWSAVTGVQTPPDFDEFPEHWYKGLDPGQFLSNPDYNISVNKYHVKASQSIEEWEKAGWIRRQDPRGFFQWYCRFWLGRRTKDDARQINRWLGCAGPRGRFKTSLIRKVASARTNVDDYDIAPILRQTLLHWAYQLTEDDFRKYIT